MRDVLVLRHSLGLENRNHADVLLLKLDRLAREHQVDSVHGADAVAELVTLPACSPEVASASRRAAA